jgi:hypothetical protein
LLQALKEISSFTPKPQKSRSLFSFLNLIILKKLLDLCLDYRFLFGGKVYEVSLLRRDPPPIKARRR